MTRDEILNMEAGREMDALVARRVMLLPNVAQEKQRVSWADGNGFHLVEHYSTAISDAWQVVEKLISNGLDNIVLKYEDEFTGKGVRAWYLYVGKGAYWSYDSYSDTAPLAICRAALIATLKPHE
jgi:hypothetical protein